MMQPVGEIAAWVHECLHEINTPNFVPEKRERGKRDVQRCAPSRWRGLGGRARRGFRLAAVHGARRRLLPVSPALGVARRPRPGRGKPAGPASRDAPLCAIRRDAPSAGRTGVRRARRHEPCRCDRRDRRR
eukprot:scaffold36071_cov74-Phaeocystis_antarctica.AAC.3